MTSQRDAFFDQLYRICKESPNTFLISSDMGAPSLDRFRRDLSRQYIDAGIAEQNAVLLACGLAKMGKKVFVYAIAPFLTYRVIEMLRLDVCAMNLPVSIIGIGAGFSYDDSGPTHHTTEDLTMLRCLPNLRIHNITDPIMASAFVRLSCAWEFPNYIRLDRHESPYTLLWDNNYGRGCMRDREEADYWIIATGNMVYRAVEVAKELDGVGVINLYTLPIQEPFLDWVQDAKGLFTLEEHELRGGMGSAVLEALSDNGLQIPVKRFGLDFRKGFCYQYGGREHLQSLFGLDKDSLVKEIREWLS